LVVIGGGVRWMVNAVTSSHAFYLAYVASASTSMQGDGRICAIWVLVAGEEIEKPSKPIRSP
jgi:hypothetical protein